MGDLNLIPGLGKSPGEGNGNPLHYSCLGNPMDRQAWWATVHRVTKSQTWLSNKAHTHTCPEKNLWMRTERREVQIDFHLEEKKKNLIVRLGLQLKKIIRILTLNILAKVIYSTFAFSQARELADCCCHSVTRSCPALCDLLDCSMPGFPVLHYFPEFAQIHVHWVSDAIQPSYPLSLFSLKGWETVFTGFGVCD